MRDILKRKSATELDQGPVTTDFEVRCDECDVSFPVGTKRCMYCGGRPGHRPLFARKIAVSPLGEIELLNEPFELDERAPDERARSAEPLVEDAPFAPTPIDEEPEEEREGRGSIFRLFGNMSWIILFALLTLYRACTG